MENKIHNFLKKRANERKTVAYSEIAPLVGLSMENPNDRDKLGKMLGEISTHEFQKGNPLLSVIVVHKNDSLPGEGFMKLARELGAVSTGTDKDEFIVEQMNRVFSINW